MFVEKKYGEKGSMFTFKIQHSAQNKFDLQVIKD